LAHSFRRILLDRDLAEACRHIRGTVLDIGGGRRRGSFQPPQGANWIVLDVDRQLNPRLLGDAHNLPVKPGGIDYVKCTELLEHVEHPEAVIKELTRVLKPGGTLILSTPFNWGIHADPYDFQRLTDQKLKRMLEDNYNIRTLKRQGLYFTVMADMIRLGILNSRRPLRLLLRPLLPLLRIMVRMDNLNSVKNSKLMNSFTTGFFVIATKKE
jgi:SAM-dependent methyltransferase